jgi:hypothetical protein
MVLLVVMLASVAVALARGGRFGNLAALNLRWRGVIIAGFLLQVIVFSSAWENSSQLRPLTPIGYTVSMLVLLVGLLANYRLPGMLLLTGGFFLNFAAILLNGGHMPASQAAMQVAGLPILQPGQTSSNSIGMGPETVAFFLGDVFAIPKGFIFPNVFSLGDVLIALGAVVLTQRALVGSIPPPNS